MNTHEAMNQNAARAKRPRSALTLALTLALQYYSTFSTGTYSIPNASATPG